MVLIFISLTISDVEHPLVSVGHLCVFFEEVSAHFSSLYSVDNNLLLHANVYNFC